jgi:dihydroflavonol-4-reductase
MNVLVTGATGFTGGHLAVHLARQGHGVRALVRPRSLERFTQSDASRAGVEAVPGDLTDRESVRRASEGVEVVYHIAATYREAGQPDSAYRAINIEGTRHVLEGAVANRVRRVVHCSTGGVHGHIAHPPANEDAPFAPGDIYQETKLEAEVLARDFGASQPIEVVVARPIGIHGPGDTRFLKVFRGIKRGRFAILGPGTIYYHLTYIDDLVEGFRLCGEVPRAAGRTYILAGARYTTLNELTAMIAEEFDVAPPRIHLPVWPFWVAGLACEIVCVPLRIEPPLYRRRVDFFTKSRAFDITRARQELGYDPKTDLRTGIHRTAEWYKKSGLL